MNSVIQQAGDDFEVIIINDGSTDDTSEVATKLAEKNSAVNYIHQNNKGLAAARNLGISKSTGTFLIFLDADDELLANALAIFREVISRCPDKQIFIGNHVSEDRTGRLRESTPNNLNISTPEQLFFGFLFKKLSISAGAYTMHRAIFNKLRFPENLKSTEDIPIYAQALALFDTVVISQSLVKIHKHDDSLRHNFNHAQAIGTNMVDVLFDAKILPANFMTYKNKYFVKRCLSLSGLAYRTGAYSLSRKWFLTAFNADKRTVLKLSRLKKFIFSCFKKDSFEQ